MPKSHVVAKLAGCCLLAGALLAGVLFPLAGGFGIASNRAADAVDNGSAQLLEGDVPAVSTMLDAKGNVIAYLYAQRRFEVPSDKIADQMKLAIVSIEDKRFAEHSGVDWKGTLRAFLTNTTSGQVEQGASTIDQQYIKNYQLLVVAQTDAERRAAIETTPARKIREIRMALTLDKELTKEEILTRYLNLVPFGNGSYGIQDAAQTYFGINASDLNWQQAAMLAGMVQSSSALNPYTNPDGVLERRNTVLDTMIANIPDQADALRAARAQPLGVLPQPKILSQGCIAANDRGFFCDYALQYLAKAGISRDQINKGGYTIKTTLDPDVQNSVQSSIAQTVPSTLSGIANVMSVVAPGQDAHAVLAMASSRKYGLDLDAGETVQPQPFSIVGDGAGSIFKVFTTAAAMEKGLGTNATLDVPATAQLKNLGYSPSPCPANTWCVKNAGTYKPTMSVTEALATSPNTAFAKLIGNVGVPATVDMAVRLGLRSYADPGSAGRPDIDPNLSMADYVKQNNSGAFTLGPESVNPLELSNVAATLASHGKWCPPSPIAAVTDRAGKPVPFTTQACEQAVDPGLADTLAVAMSKDDQAGGTSASSAAATGWNLPLSAKTGTTETSKSSAFLGFTNNFAAASYIYNDGTQTSDLCSYPLRTCGSGNLFGGNEPARVWFNAMKPIANNFGPLSLPSPSVKYQVGAANGQVPNVAGLSQSAATARLQALGFSVDSVTISGSQPAGTVISASPSGSAIPGSTITLTVSDGSAPPPSPSSKPGAPPTITIPGLPPIVIGGGG